MRSVKKVERIGINDYLRLEERGVSGRLSAWHHRLQEIIIRLFNVRRQVKITIESHDENGLAWIFSRVA